MLKLNPFPCRPVSLSFGGIKVGNFVSATPAATVRANLRRGALFAEGLFLDFYGTVEILT